MYVFLLKVVKVTYTQYWRKKMYICSYDRKVTRGIVINIEVSYNKE
mgnify:CR=1 FL=1